MIIDKLKRKPAADTVDAAAALSTNGMRSSPKRKGPDDNLAPRALEHSTFYTDLPFSSALGVFRREVGSAGLRIPMEMDVSGQIRDELGIGLRPCHVLCIDCPYLLLQAAVWDGSGAAFLPVRLVFTSSGSGTSIHFAGPLDAGVPHGLRIPFARFLARLVSVLDRVGAQKPELSVAS